MRASQQFTASNYQRHQYKLAEPQGQAYCISSEEPTYCPPLKLLSESAPNLVSPVRSHEELDESRSLGLSSPCARLSSNNMELETFQAFGPGERSTSAASLTFNDYASPCSGDSTPTSSGGSACGSAYGNATGTSSGDDSAFSADCREACGASVSNAVAAAVSRVNHNERNPCPTISDDVPAPASGVGGAPRGDAREAAPAAPEAEAASAAAATDMEVAAAAAAVAALSGDEDGPFVPRKFHVFDVQLARMLAAVAEAGDASPAELLQVLLNFAQEDSQDLLNALVESGCSCVHLLACHLHNLRTMAEEAIDDSAGGGDGKDGSAVAEGAGARTASVPTATARSSKAATDGHSGRKNKGAVSSASAAAALSREAECDDKAAQEALRASILDQYRRVVCRLVDTALGFVKNGARKAQQVVLPAPPPPPPPPPGGRSGAGGGGGGRVRAENLSRSRSTPIPSVVSAVPPPPPPGGASTCRARGGPGPGSKPSVALPAAMCQPQIQPVAAAAAALRPSTTSRASGDTATGGDASLAAASADSDAAAAATSDLVGGEVLQAVMQQLGRGGTPAAEVVEALAAHGLGSAAAPGGPIGAAPPAAEQLLAAATQSSLAARGRSMSQSFTVAPTSAPVTTRGRAVMASPFMGAGAREAGALLAQPAAVAVPGRSAAAGPAATQLQLRTLGALQQQQHSRTVTVVNAPSLQRLHSGGELLLDQRRAAALLLQQERQQQEQLLLQQQQQQQQLLQQLQLQQQVRQQLQQQQQQQQRLQQQQQEQHLRELQLLEIFASADGGVPLGLTAQGVVAPALSAVPPPALAPQADALSVAATAQLIHAYDSAAAFTAEPCIWRQTSDPLAGLSLQVGSQQLPLPAPFANNSPAVGLHTAALSHQQLLLAMQGGLLPVVGAGAVGGHAGASAAVAAAAATMPLSVPASFGTAQVPVVQWML